jgi:hypothetical protein
MPVSTVIHMLITCTSIPSVQQVADILDCFTSCFAAISQWMAANKLQLSPDKTNCIWFHSPGCSIHSFPDLVARPVVIHPSDYVHSLDMYLDQHLKFDRQTAMLSIACFFHLRQIKSRNTLIRAPFAPYFKPLLATKID